MNKNIEIVSLIFKSKDYLESIVNEFLNEYSKAEDWDVGHRVIANDATEEVIEEMKKYEKLLPESFKMDYYSNPEPDRFYMKRVYDAWNYCAESSKYDNICLTGSDHAWSKDWLKNLLKHHDGNNIPSCRLVESGKMPSLPNGINAMRDLGENFGFNLKDFNREAWEIFSEGIKEDCTKPNGMFMPAIFETKRFLEAGGYESDKYSVAPLFMPDAELFKKLNEDYNMKHVTVYDSIAYHIQEGEKDE